MCQHGHVVTRLYSLWSLVFGMEMSVLDVDWLDFDPSWSYGNVHNGC